MSVHVTRAKTGTPKKYSSCSSTGSSNSSHPDLIWTIHQFNCPKMVQPRLLAPFRVLERAFAPTLRTTPQLYQPQSLLQRTLSATPPVSKPIPSLRLLPLSHVRHASHASQGQANRHARRPAGKRLGAKRTGGEYVVRGCIIFRQRGTKWFPGENCDMGRDHTIYATEAGYVRYYLDPHKHPDRKFIGIVFDKDGKLPRPRNAPTARKLNKILAPRREDKFAPASDLITAGQPAATGGGFPAEDAASGPQLRPGYMYREANWQIGRAAEKAGIITKPFNRKNRWVAWRKRQAKRERGAQMRSLRGKNQSKKKKAKKGKGGR